MRRTITVVEPIHLWLQHIRGWHLQNSGTDFSYTALVNYYLGHGLCSASKMSEKERKEFNNEIYASADLAIAGLEDEMDNVWLAKELPKIIEKAKKKDEETKFSFTKE